MANDFDRPGRLEHAKTQLPAGGDGRRNSSADLMPGMESRFSPRAAAGASRQSRWRAMGRRRFRQPADPRQPPRASWRGTSPHSRQMAARHAWAGSAAGGQYWPDAGSALRAVQRRDPNWRPTPQAYETVEGLIRANESVTQEAMLRALQLRLPRTGIGPYAKEWLAAPATNRRLNRAEQAEIDRIGRTYGCHWCGIKSPGTWSGHFIGDHQIPRSVGRPSRIYPHCLWCSSSQGGLLSKGRF